MFTKRLKPILSFLPLLIIIIAGFLFRLKGIQDNHSFWADEGYISSFARDIVMGKLSIAQGVYKVWYQPLQILTTSIFFFIFGISEFSARLPSVIIGSVGIVFAYFVAQKLSSTWGGLLAAFAYGFSQLNLANATQAKPYTIITVLFFMNIYLYLLLTESNNSQDHKVLFHIAIIILSTLATLFHSIGIFVWIPYTVFLFVQYSKSIRRLIKMPVILAILSIFFVLGFYLFGLSRLLMLFVIPVNGRILPYDNSIYLKNLFFRQYGIFFIPSLISLFFLWKKNKAISIGVGIYMCIILFLWNFRQYSHNIRYLVPFFGVTFVFFGIFWGKIGEYLSSKLKVKHLKLIPLAVIIILYFSGYKIVKSAQHYYSPNTDFYGDVQIADYKSIFTYIQKKFPNLKDIALFNDSIDAQRWYLEKIPEAYFVKKSANFYINTSNNVSFYSSLDYFLKEKSKYPKGLLIVEDWDSFLPEDIKLYAKKNMKLEFRIENLPQAHNDPWPLEVYSWGIEYNKK